MLEGGVGWGAVEWGGVGLSGVEWVGWGGLGWGKATSFKGSTPDTFEPAAVK